ncbi:WecB/TagA/CpsF family glycosyltransferase [Pontiella sulfatireligans]|uniref:N-acetylglucosaminyldiphosphoundecaprenol N-acetyl-beta-D-mannosaminyltransferase n=1 Tax=Pontiella sulfatireligans TaxID=2750658 RepID=A0A6C2UM77_9BACT|nr:WecB/TagA/CpsF family glycosyltransferase [Pontiella sulfatireligans]VGO21380.1 N-acetylglucosaminyldiphosphoundecaprenol N-acetyl-beta-D-mannosaminyltransferase [Pontiella sulfatireligans]
MANERSAPLSLAICGVPFHNVSFDEAVEWIVDRVRSGRPANIATANLDFVTRAWSDPELQRILIDADLVLADGFPIVKLAPFFGPALKGRVTGSDLTPMLAKRASAEGFSIYGLGAAVGVAEKAMAILKERHPELKVAGISSPPYVPLLEMDHRGILQQLDTAKPDILFVALGSPKQEKFISMHVRGWNVPVAMGVGASLDFVAGEQRRAPVWVQRIYLEWLWRICSSPRRLFRRYMANLGFLFSATLKMFSIHCMADKPVPFHALVEEGIQALGERGISVERFQRLESEDAARGFVERLAAATVEAHVLVDLHAVPWLDSLELGALLEVNKSCRSRSRRLILYGLRAKVRRLLETCHLIDYFDTADSLDAVEGIVQNLKEHADGGTLYEEGALTLELPIELTAATIPRFEKEADFIRHELKEQGILKTVEVDAAQLDFIDSSGLGFLISLKKATQDEGVSMSIANLAAKPRRTFEIARVDKILLHG